MDKLIAWVDRHGIIHHDYLDKRNSIDKTMELLSVVRARLEELNESG